MSGAAAAAAVIAAYTSLQAAEAAERQGQAQKQQADFNAEVSRLQGLDAINRGASAAEQHRMKAAQLQASQRAAMGASGGDVESGTFAEMQLGTKTMGEQDAQTIRTNSLREAWGYENQSTSYTMAGKEALTSAQEKAAYYRASAASSLLTGTSKLGKSMGWFDKNPVMKFPSANASEAQA